MNRIRNHKCFIFCIVVLLAEIYIGCNSSADAFRAQLIKEHNQIIEKGPLLNWHSIKQSSNLYKALDSVRSSVKIGYIHKKWSIANYTTIDTNNITPLPFIFLDVLEPDSVCYVLLNDSALIVNPIAYQQFMKGRYRLNVRGAYDSAVYYLARGNKAGWGMTRFLYIK